MRAVMNRWLGIVALAVATLAAALPANAAGFGIYEQGSRSMGMAMAFTAQADDPSALYYNVGGLGLFQDRDFYAGVTFISLGDSSFRGLDPSPGAGVTGNQKNQIVIPPHVYWVEPLSDRVNFGLSVTSPFGLVTEWDDPDNWAGRFVSEKAELKDIDLTPSVGFKVGDNLGIGIGLVVRFSDVELRRRAALINPFTQEPAEIAKVVLKSDTDTGYGFNLGVLHRVSDFFSWGFSYRSRVTVDYSGDGVLTQVSSGDPAFDMIVASQISFDQKLPIETSIEFPDEASLGLAFQINPQLLFEADFNWTGWSTFDKLVIDFTTADALDSTRVEAWDDAINIRTGVRWDRSDRSHWRFGFYWDESPQPIESVSPLLPDANRLGYTVGWGRQWKTLSFDVALLYVDFDTRTTTTSRDGLYGTYNTDTLLLGTSIGW